MSTKFVKDVEFVATANPFAVPCNVLLVAQWECNEHGHARGARITITHGTNPTHAVCLLDAWQWSRMVRGGMVSHGTPSIHRA